MNLYMPMITALLKTWTGATLTIVHVARCAGVHVCCPTHSPSHAVALTPSNRHTHHRSHAFQIRAAALSGDCSRWMELLRGNWRLTGQYQECIKRRAALSIQDACPGGAEEAQEVVKRNFETCFGDTRPFATHPNA